MTRRELWRAEFRMARLVRGFEVRALAGEASSLAVAHFDAWCAHMNHGDHLRHSRTNGRYGINKTTRCIVGPRQGLPA